MNKWAALVSSMVYLILALLCGDNKEALVILGTASLVMYGIAFALACGVKK